MSEIRAEGCGVSYTGADERGEREVEESAPLHKTLRLP